MPELPEVETIKNSLYDQIIGQQINNIEILFPTLRYPIPLDLPQICYNASIKHLRRRAKYLIIELNNGYNLIIHLGMSGKLIYHDKLLNQLQKHDHFIINFSNKTQVIYNDTRRFGLIDYCKDSEIDNLKYFKNLGPEPLSENFNAQYLFDKLQNKNTEIKVVIMDQNLVVGVGNIYACESLFMSKINPTIKAKDLTFEQCKNLVSNIRIVLEKAIKAGGSSLKDYVNSSGKSGYFQHQFLVYGKHNKECSICSNLIKKIVQTGRSTFYCQNCQ